jgi:PIN domain nuclease of toxin-antitoxin system
MRLLLDTHVALWAITDDPRLSSAAGDLIADPANTIVVSAASIWEIAIKRAIARGDMPVSASEAIEWFANSGYLLLDISPLHAAAVESLPAIHNDPFDRLLVAQALVEPLRLLTRDRLVAAYSDTTIMV